MANQLTSNAEALRLFFTDDVYLVQSDLEVAEVMPAVEPPVQVQSLNLEQSVVLDVPKAPDITKARVEFDYLGKNQKGILILVNDHNNKVSSPQGVELLRKLVKAIALTNNDFALINYASYQGVAFDELNEFFKCQLVLSFGVDASYLGLAEQPLHQLNDMEPTRLIFTTNLHDLYSDQAGKKMLWATLQSIK